jgi:hypothetical protein
VGERSVVEGFLTHAPRAGINGHGVDMAFLGQFFAFFPTVKSGSLSINTPGVQSFTKMTIIDFRHVTWFGRHFQVAETIYFMQ